MRNQSVRWMDMGALHRAVLDGDRLAFAEMRRRFDPLVREQVSRVVPIEAVDAEVAGFWSGLREKLIEWSPEDSPLFTQWLAKQLRAA